MKVIALHMKIHTYIRVMNVFLIYVLQTPPIPFPQRIPHQLPSQTPRRRGQGHQIEWSTWQAGTSHTLSPHTPVRGRSLIHHSLCFLIPFLLSKCQSSVRKACTLIRSYKILLTRKPLTWQSKTDTFVVEFSFYVEAYGHQSHLSGVS